MLSKVNYTQNNKLSLLRNGQEFYQEFLQIIKNSKRSIFLHMYIFDYDEDTKIIIEELINKSKSGVAIYILIDGFGSFDFPQKIIEKMRANDISINFYEHIFSLKFKTFGRRLHQKLILSDSHQAIIGGANLAKEFFNPVNDQPWLDYACKIEGEAIKDIQTKILRHYLKNFKDQHASIKMFLSQEVKLPISSTCKVKVIENDYTHLKNEIQKSFNQAVKNANKNIFITAPYFLPSKKFLRLLKQAIDRGVRVILIFGKRSDVETYNLASRFLFEWYLENGFELYEWKESILHGKIALIDHQWVSIGSYNHNIISQFANIELNLEIQDKSFNTIVLEEFAKIKALSLKVEPHEYKSKTIFHKALYALTYSLATIINLVQLLLIIRKRV